MKSRISSPLKRGFLHTLFLTPPLWVSMLPGFALVLLDNFCWFQWWQSVCGFKADYLPRLDIFILLVDGLIYFSALYLRAKKILNQDSRRFHWLREGLLLIVGEFIIFWTVALFAASMMTHI